MGAELYTETVYCKEADLEKEFESMKDDQKDRNGHQDGYSGDFQNKYTLKITGKTFDNERQFEDWVGDRSEKWDEDVYVTRFKDNMGKSYWYFAAWCAC